MPRTPMWTSLRCSSRGQRHGSTHERTPSARPAGRRARSQSQRLRAGPSRSGVRTVAELALRLGARVGPVLAEDVHHLVGELRRVAGQLRPQHAGAAERRRDRDTGCGGAAGARSRPPAASRTARSWTRSRRPGSSARRPGRARAPPGGPRPRPRRTRTTRAGRPGRRCRASSPPGGRPPSSRRCCRRSPRRGRRRRPGRGSRRRGRRPPPRARPRRPRLGALVVVAAAGRGARATRRRASGRPGRAR